MAFPLSRTKVQVLTMTSDWPPSPACTHFHPCLHPPHGSLLPGAFALVLPSTWTTRPPGISTAPPSSVCSNVIFSVRSVLTPASKLSPPPTCLLDFLGGIHCQQTLQKTACLVSYYYDCDIFLPHWKTVHDGRDICAVYCVSSLEHAWHKSGAPGNMI